MESRVGLSPETSMHQSVADASFRHPAAKLSDAWEGTEDLLSCTMVGRHLELCCTNLAVVSARLS